MRTQSIRSYCLAGLLVAGAMPAPADDLSITISAIPGAAGEVFWTLFDNAAAYASGDGALLSARQRVDGDSVRFTVHDLKPGRYAVKIFHDENGNGALDTNVIGIPKEGYGFSNNGGRFGQPSFDDAAVAVDDAVSIDIEVR